jgi:putative peptidoglycan lipid II flippase
MSIMEINLFVSTSLASYLPKGSISLVYYANRFMGIPLGVFAVALSTILLPHFSRIKKEGVAEFSFYIYEAAKLIFWVTVPVSLIMGILSDKIFSTLFLSKNFTALHVQQASGILIIFLSCLFFFSLNKVLVNVYYALHDTRTPVLVSLSAAVSNYALSKVMLNWWGIYGLVGAFVIAGAVQTVIYVLLLKKRFNIEIPFGEFFRFVRTASIQIMCAVSLFMGLYYGIMKLLFYFVSVPYAAYLTNSLGLWVWVGPLLALVYAFLHQTRNLFNVKGHFLE